MFSYIHVKMRYVCIKYNICVNLHVYRKHSLLFFFHVGIYNANRYMGVIYSTCNTWTFARFDKFERLKIT